LNNNSGRQNNRPYINMNNEITTANYRLMKTYKNKEYNHISL